MRFFHQIFANARSLNRNSSLSIASRSFSKLLSHSEPPSFGIAFDIDGVILRGETPVGNSPKALKRLYDDCGTVKIPYAFLTNGGGIPESKRASQLSKLLGLNISPLQVIQGHSPFKQLVNRFENELIIAVGKGEPAAVMTDYGFKNVSGTSDMLITPSISSAVELHRNLLGVLPSTPFWQYTRLTVVVDIPAQASALNSGTPILKSYDIAAVRPLNQNAFEQACQTSEVDLIAIDFLEKLLFRLKQSIVKAAIELLVDWTRGKNLIVSSAAPSVTKLRGPNDIANLSSLLGLSIERAKAAISKNCRFLIVNALNKKYFYKEAIRVEVIPSGKQFDSMGSGFDDWLKWDPISSGEGDLQLDDIEKAFNASNKTSNTMKAIYFASVLDSLPPNGLQIKDLISSTNSGSEPPDIGKNLSTIKEPQVPVLGYGVSEPPERLKILNKDTKILFSSTEKGLTNSKEIGDCTPAIDEEPNISNGFDIETEALDLESQICRTNCEMDLMIQDDNATVHTLVQDCTSFHAVRGH